MVSVDFFGDCEIGIRRFNRGRKGGKRRPQIYWKRSKQTFEYCSRCGHVMTKNERRQMKRKQNKHGSSL